ncbi:hypothetical protein KY330_01500 [Candidatus Woesearchaeota archaeon]|nr:hypothetical protein [Candidatus Woesearchaeota archaeon]
MAKKVKERAVGKYQVAKLGVTYNGVFNLKELYKLIHEWLKDADWQDKWDANKEMPHEIMYHERTGISGLKDMWIWWRLKKASPNKYYWYELDINYLVLAVKKTEIVHEGKKVKSDVGEVVIDIIATLMLNQKEWDKHPILKMFRYWFPERVFKEDLEAHKKELYDEAYKLQGAIKKFLHLKGFLSEMEVEPFTPSLVYDQI